ARHADGSLRHIHLPLPHVDLRGGLDGDVHRVAPQVPQRPQVAQKGAVPPIHHLVSTILCLRAGEERLLPLVALPLVDFPPLKPVAVLPPPILLRPRLPPHPQQPPPQPIRRLPLLGQPPQETEIHRPLPGAGGPALQRLRRREPAPHVVARRLANLLPP